MKSLAIKNSDFFSVSRMIVNKSEEEKVTIEDRAIQHRLQNFNMLIKSSLNNLLNFLVDYQKEHRKNPQEVEQNVRDLFNEVKNELKDIDTHGIAPIENMVALLRKKEINHDTMEYLIRILDHQERMFKHMVGSELRVDRIEVVLSYLKDMPYYLQADLELNKLPNKEIRQRKLNTSTRQLNMKYVKPIEKVMYSYNKIA